MRVRVHRSCLDSLYIAVLDMSSRDQFAYMDAMLDHREIEEKVCLSVYVCVCLSLYSMRVCVCVC